MCSRASSKRPAIARSAREACGGPPRRARGRSGSTRGAPRSGGSPRRPASGRRRASCRASRSPAGPAWSPASLRMHERALERGAGLVGRAFATSAWPEQLARPWRGRACRRAARTSRSRPPRPSPSRPDRPPDRTPAAGLERWTSARAASPRSSRPVAASRLAARMRVGLRDPPGLAEKVGELDLDARALARVGDPSSSAVESLAAASS